MVLNTAAASNDQQWQNSTENRGVMMTVWCVYMCVCACVRCTPVSVQVLVCRADEPTACCTLSSHTEPTEDKNTHTHSYNTPNNDNNNSMSRPGKQTNEKRKCQSEWLINFVLFKMGICCEIS